MGLSRLVFAPIGRSLSISCSSTRRLFIESFRQTNTPRIETSLNFSMREVWFAFQHQVQAMICHPFLAEQRPIVAKAQQLMSVVDALETQLAAFVAELSGQANANAAWSAT